MLQAYAGVQDPLHELCNLRLFDVYIWLPSSRLVEPLPNQLPPGFSGVQMDLCLKLSRVLSKGRPPPLAPPHDAD